MTVTVDLIVDAEASGDIPGEALMSHWCNVAHQTLCDHSELPLTQQSSGKTITVCVRVVTPAASAELNLNYRQRDNATNVLSFGSELPDFVLESLDEFPMGDLVICADVVSREAGEQHKKLLHHWAHMVVHGFFHLNGLDHQNDVEAQQMESLETKTLAALNIPDPYFTAPYTTDPSVCME